MERKLINLTFSILVLLVFLSHIIPINTIAILPPIVELKFDPGEETQTAEVSPGDNSTVVFHGTVTADLALGGSFQDIIVNLQGSTDYGWPVTVVPATLLLRPGEEAPFVANVAITPEVSSSIIGTLTIEGTATAFPGSLRYTIQSITGTILISQFYRFSVSSKEPYQEACRDSEVCLNLTIANQGNGYDSFSIEVTNLNDLSLKAFITQINTPKIDIVEGAIGVVSILIKTPASNSCLGVHNIEIETKSIEEELNLGSTVPQSYIFNLRVTSTLNQVNGGDGGNGDDYYPVEDEDDVNLTPGFEASFIIFTIGLVSFLHNLKRARKIRRK